MRQHPKHIKPQTFASVIRAYMASQKFAALADNTRSSYLRILKVAELPDTLGAISTEIIRPALVQAFLDGYGDRPSQQKNALSVLKAVERFAVVRDLLPWPITTGCEAPGGDGGYAPWSDEQVRLAELCARPDLARVITLGANTGQRGSDLVRMRWTDIETYDGRPGINVVQKKTGLKLWIPLTQDLTHAIAVWERRPGFLLLKQDGKPWTRELLSNAWLHERDHNKSLVSLSEAGCVLHGLRSTAVVRLRRAGATTGQIKDMVGMSEEMVNGYCRLSMQRENAMAAIVHLDRTHIEREKKEPGRNRG